MGGAPTLWGVVRVHADVSIRPGRARGAAPRARAGGRSTRRTGRAGDRRAGGVALVHAGAGLGKSRLLAEAARLAAERSVGFAPARGRELDVDAPFGVVQQLLQPPLARAAPARREELLSGAAALAAPVLA